MSDDWSQFELIDDSNEWNQFESIDAPTPLDNRQFANNAVAFSTKKSIPLDVAHDYLKLKDTLKYTDQGDAIDTMSVATKALDAADKAEKSGDSLTAFEYRMRAETLLTKKIPQMTGEYSKYAKAIEKNPERTNGLINYQNIIKNGEVTLDVQEKAMKSAEQYRQKILESEAKFDKQLKSGEIKLQEAKVLPSLDYEFEYTQDQADEDDINATNYSYNTGVNFEASRYRQYLVRKRDSAKFEAGKISKEAREDIDNYSLYTAIEKHPEIPHSVWNAYSAYLDADNKIKEIDSAANELYNAKSSQELGRKLLKIPVVGDIALMGIGAGGRLASAAIRNLGEALPDINKYIDTDVLSQAIQKDLQNIKAGAKMGFVRRMIQGSGESFLTATAGSAIGGPSGAIALFSVSQANESYNDAIFAGMSVNEAKVYATRSGIIEGGIATAFQAAGHGGLESIYSSSVGKGVRAGAKFLGKSILDEIMEEVPTEFLHALNESASGVNPESLSPEQLSIRIRDTIIQTALAVGAGGISPIIDANKADLSSDAVRLINSISGQDIEAEIDNAVQQDPTLAEAAQEVRTKLFEITNEIEQAVSQEIAPEATEKPLETPQIEKPTQNTDEEFRIIEPYPAGEKPRVRLKAPKIEPDSTVSIKDGKSKIVPQAQVKTPNDVSKTINSNKIPKTPGILESSSRFTPTRESMSRLMGFLGRGMVPSFEQKAIAQSHQEALDRNIPDNALEIADSVSKNPRLLSEVEILGLAHKGLQLDSEIKNLTKQLSEATEPDKISYLTSQMDSAIGNLELLTTGIATGSNQVGRALRSLQTTILPETDLTSNIVRAKRKKKGELGRETIRQLTDLTQRYNVAIEKAKSAEMRQKTEFVSKQLQKKFKNKKSKPSQQIITENINKVRDLLNGGC